MNDLERPVTIPVQADISGFTAAMADMRKQSNQFGTAFTGAIRSAITSGKSFESVLKSLALRLSQIALKSALKPIETSLSGLFQGVLGGIMPSAKGSVVTGQGITPFAKGGIVSAATLFSAGNRVGLMGEAGAEAIMPLARGPDGRLGVRGDRGTSPINITFNVSTPDAASFRKSEAQIASMVARTVARSRRAS